MTFALARLGDAGHERPFVIVDGVASSIESLTTEIDGAFLESGGIARVRAALADGTLTAAGTVEELGLRYGAPVAQPTKVVCVGLNYRDHAEETSAVAPTEPILFMKDPSTVIGPDDEVLVPRLSVKTDWEVELAVIIGQTGRYLTSDADALACIAGFAVANDVSEREFQIERGGQWDKGKSCETFNPLGPWLVPTDEIADPQALGLRLWVNGEQRQNGNTTNMIFGVVEVVRYISQFMVLRPGDVINTGTPAGVALGQPEPKPFLRAGDVVELEIDGLGRQRQQFGQA
jgi:2-keto-4-pentenoate hydratase/2-oxohepta-3-ene-1,7-dioic acid hydratase in catechol pathway